MTAAIVGGRNFFDKQKMIEVLSSYNIEKVVSGGASGADTLAAVYANENNLQLIEYLPEWSKYGKMAAYIRNEKIVQAADMVIAFWDGKSKGTKMTIDLAGKYKKQCVIVMY